jgi:hypothetical protein
MVDVIHKTCNNEWCNIIVSNNKYDGYCLHCFKNMFPEDKRVQNNKTKEYSVVDFVKTNYSTYDWVKDKTIQGGLSRRRPDLFLELNNQVVIIEIDENQHIDYDCSCENKCMMELSQDVQHRPIVFIRFNPDDYTSGEKKITSCWGANKNGICVVKKTKQTEWSDRLNALKSQIDYWTQNNTEKTIEIIQLFYDN